jgi:hypothetical protein
VKTVHYTLKDASLSKPPETQFGGPCREESI